MSESNEMPLYTYNRAKGMNPAEAAHSARTSVIMTYVLWLKLTVGTVLISSIMFVCMNPMYEHAAGFERMRFIWWATLVGLVLSAYFPIKAKSIIFWGLYAILLSLVAFGVLISV